MPEGQIPAPKEEKIAPRWPKRALKALFWTLGICLFLVLIPIILLFVYEKEIKSAIITEINTHLKTKVFIEPQNIDLTILSTFPKAAIVFKDVTIMGALPELTTDTLLQARSIYLLFNARDIWNKKYVIQQIDVRGADLRLQTNKDGLNNFDIWEEEADSVVKGQKSTDFKLEKVGLSEFKFLYKNNKAKVKMGADFSQVLLSGNFSDKAYELKVQAEGRLDIIKSGKRSFLKNKRLKIDLSGQVNNGTYTLTQSEIGLNKLFFTATGWISEKGKETPCQIDFKGKNIDIVSVLSWLPEDFQEKLKDYSGEGAFSSTIGLEGNLQDYDELSIKASFGTKGSKLTYQPKNTTLSDVSLSGSFIKEKGGIELLEMHEIKARQNDNYVEGDFSLSNFNKPYLKLTARGNYNLKDFFSLVPIDTIQDASGSIDFEVNANINMDDARARQMATSSAKGKIDLKDISFTFKGNEALRLPGGQILVENENLETKNLQIVHGKTTLDVSGKAINFLNYLLKPEQPLEVALTVRSSFVNVDDFILPANNKKSSETENPFNLQDNIRADLQLNIAQIVFREFTGKNLLGQLEIKNKRLLAKNLSFEAFDGDITLTGVADASQNDKLNIKGSTNLVDVNIRKMFTQLNNFGQDVIEAKNLNGKATTQIDFTATWNNQLQCDLQSIEASAELGIVNGELIDYKVLEYLADYVELKELKHVKFSNLQTHVDIKNKTIFISRTSLKNSALDIEASGSHSFDNVIDYSIKLRLSDWLAKRPGKNKQLDEELQETENDPDNKRCVFLHMTGTTDKPVITYDRKAMKQKIKEDIKEEKNNLKKILNEEFGWFKKDTTSFKKDEKKQDQKFKIDFNQKKDEKKKKEEQDGEDF